MMQHQVTTALRRLHANALCGCGVVRSVVWVGVCFFGFGLAELSAQPLIGRNAPADPAAGNGVRRAGMDRYDLRAAEDAGRSEKFALVQKSFERQRWDEGAQQIQSLLNDDHDSLVFGEDRVWRPASEVALQLIRQSPPEAQRAYDARFHAIAERDLKLAQQAHDLASVALVARRYLLTTAGQRACRELIDAAIDHGNSDAIAQLVRDLLRVESPLYQDDAWRDQLLEILAESGHLSLVKQLTEQTGVPTQALATSGPWNLNHFGAQYLPITEWTTLAGSPTGQSVARTEDLSLLPRWRHPLVVHPRVRRLLREQHLKYEDEGSLGLSVLATVGTGEVLVTRTLSNLTAVNAQTGQTLWQSREWAPRPAVTDEEGQSLIEPSRDRDDQYSLDHRIRHRLTSCASLGTLSADARHVYALASFTDEQAPLEEVVQSGFNDSESGTTFLYARDLHTGRIVWRAGGPVAEEPPGLPAAGVFFFGPPTPDEEELFAVGEREGDIFLFCLEAETGLVRWEQLLAAAGRRLIGDAVRKSWTAPVAVRGSLVVCTTTTGWLTAIDRVSRRIHWSVRMVPRAPVHDDPAMDLIDNRNDDGSNREGSLDERWPPLQPILLRDRVIVAPIEFPDETGATQPKLLCYDLNSGDMLWELAKESQVGVVGASEERLYLFDQFSVRAVQTAQGAPAWTCPIEELIAGRPLLTQSGIIVPTRAGTMVRVNSVDGKVIERLRVGEVPIREPLVARLLSPEDPQALSLGHLISLGGRLISVSPRDMKAFEWKADEARWQADSPTSVDSSLRWGQSQALRGQFAEAARTLRDSGTLAAITPAQAARQRQALLAVLFLQLEAELQGVKSIAGQQGRLDEMSGLATSPEDREAVQRLGIELALQAGEWDNAWAQIREAIRQPLTFPVEMENRVVSPEAWLADRILTLARIPDVTRSDSLRVAIREEFQALWTAAVENRMERIRLLQLFAETPFVDRAEFESLTAPDESTSLTRLQALTHSRDRGTADRATLRLIERLATPDWVGEARRRFALWTPAAADWPDEHRTARQELEQKLSGIADVHQAPNPSWLGRTIDVQRRVEESSSEDTELPLLWIGEPCEALENYCYRYDDTLQFVSIERADGSRYGELLLASNDENQLDESAPVLYGSGLNLYIVHMGVIHAFSVPEKRLLWQRQTELDSTSDQVWGGDDHARWQLLNPQAGKNDHTLVRNSMNFFLTANSRQVVARTRRGIEILDVIQGHHLWSIPRYSPTRVRTDRGGCDDDRLYRLWGPDLDSYSIRSGRPLEMPHILLDSIPWLTSLDHRGLTTLRKLRASDGLTLKLEHIRCSADPIAGREGTSGDRWDEQDLLHLESVWTQTVAADDLLGSGPPGQGVWIEKSGAVHLLDWATGRQHELGTAVMNDEVLQAARARGDDIHVYASWDRSQLIVATSLSVTEDNVECPSLPVQGVLSVHSRDRSQPDWHASTKGLLLTQSLDRSPFLPILHLENLPVKDVSCQRVHLTLIDKQTGQVVHELRTPTSGTGASGCEYELLTQRWSLYLPEERIRLQPRAGLPP